MEHQVYTQADLLTIWEQIGNNNTWIKKACDPSFNRQSFCKCNTLEELEARIQQGNWCLGQAFYYQNLCFINQINGGDEWLTIKDDYDFESFTFEHIIKRGTFQYYMQDMLTATKEECIQLRYKKTTRR